MGSRAFRLLSVTMPALVVFALIGMDAAPASYKTTTSSYYNAVACPTALICMAVGTKEVDRKTASGTLVGGSFTPVAARSLDGGKTWAPVTIQGANGDLLGVSCWSADSCVAVGATEALAQGVWSATNAVVIRLNASAAERTSPVPAGALALDSVSCLPQGTCVAVGGSRVPKTLTLRPQVLVSHDGGGHWSGYGLPIGTGELQGVECKGPLNCVAVGATTYVSGGAALSRPVALYSSGGTSWQAGAIAGGGDGQRGGGANAVACTTATSCVAVGDIFDWCECGTGTPGRYAETWTTANGGRTWDLHRLPTVGGYDMWYANAITCWGPTRCAMAATGTTTKTGSLYYAFLVPLAAASGGVSGPATSSLGGLRPQYIYGLDCRDAADCVAVGENWLSPASATIETSSAGRWTTTFTVH